MSVLVILLSKIWSAIIYISESQTLSKVRVSSYQSRGAKIASGSEIQSGARIIGSKNFTCGKGCFIARDVRVHCSDGAVRLGDNVLIAESVKLITRNHNFKDKSTLIKRQGYISKDINIGDDVWIGFNCIILPGVSIGKGAVIAAGSVVTKNVADYEVVAGIPASRISTRSNPRL